MNQRIFLCNGNYKLLETSGLLTTKTADEVRLFCQQNRGVTIVFFQLTTEAAPTFLSQSDARVKTINLTNYLLEELTGSFDRELNGCFDLVVNWIVSLYPSMGIRSIADLVKTRKEV